MLANRKTARFVGALFLFSNITFILGAIIFVEPLLNAPDYLTAISANRAKLVLGVLLELSNAVAYIGIAALMFPILKHRFESMALGYFGFRIIEFVTQILTDLSPLSLLSLSEQFISAGSPQASAFQTLGMLLIAERSWAFQMLSITFGLSALLFYIMLYRSKLIPRFISIWGFAGAAIVLLNTVFDMLSISIPNLGVLMLLNELFLGVWLIVRGFNQSARE